MEIWNGAKPGFVRAVANRSRIALAVGALAAAVLLAGCSSSGATQTKATDAPAKVADTTVTSCPPRRTPANLLDLPKSTDPAAKTEVIPFALSSALFCVYDPSKVLDPSKTFLYQSTTITDSVKLARLRTEMQAAPEAGTPPGGAVNGPSVDGKALMIYGQGTEKGQSIQVYVALDGAWNMSNGTGFWPLFPVKPNDPDFFAELSELSGLSDI